MLLQHAPRSLPGFDRALSTCRLKAAIWPRELVTDFSTTAERFTSHHDNHNLVVLRSLVIPEVINPYPLTHQQPTTTVGFSEYLSHTHYQGEVVGRCVTTHGVLAYVYTAV